MIDWITQNINIMANKNKNVILYPDTLEKRNRRLGNLREMDKNEEINYWISQLKILEDELLVQETMNDRAIIRKDIYKTRLKINELVRELTD